VLRGSTTGECGCISSLNPHTITAHCTHATHASLRAAGKTRDGGDGGDGGGDSGGKRKAASFAPVRERPNDWCKKVFVANVSWEAEDDDVSTFFGGVEAEIAKVCVCVQSYPLPLL
jgi:hypothetical protein